MFGFVVSVPVAVAVAFAFGITLVCASVAAGFAGTKSCSCLVVSGYGQNNIAPNWMGLVLLCTL